VGPERVVIEATVQLPESGLHLDRRFVIEKARPLLRLDELVENRSNELVEFTWTQHLTFGSDLLGPGVRLLLPSCAQVFDSGGITGRSTDRSTDREGAGEAWNPHSEAPLPEQGSRFLTLDGIKEARVGLENQRRGLGVELRWDLAAMPCLWYWAVKEPAITALGLEPSTTSLPDYGAASAAGMTCHLEPGETKNLWLELELYRTQVWGMRASGSRLQVPRRPNTQYPGDKHGIEA